MISTSRILPTLILVCSALFFFGCQPQESSGANTETTGATAGAASGLKVVYIRLDSLQNGYTELATELGRLEDNAAKAQENIQKQVLSLIHI